MTLDRLVKQAAVNGKAAVARELAKAGEQFNRNIASEVVTTIRLYPAGILFYKCAAEAAVWAGFVQKDDPAWRVDALQYLQYQSPHLKTKYRKGYRTDVDLSAYLDSWCAIFNHASVPVASGQKTLTVDLVRFFQDAATALAQIESMHQRSWLGAWTFYGAFKLYLLHESQLWIDPQIDAITLPMGGREQEGFSFEHGWAILEKLGIVTPLPMGQTFRDKVAASIHAHAEVHALAALANSRALHVNSGIYFLGSS